MGYIGADSLANERARKKAGQKAFKAGLVVGGKPTAAGRRAGGGSGGYGGFGGGKGGNRGRGGPR